MERKSGNVQNKTLTAYYGTISCLSISYGLAKGTWVIEWKPEKMVFIGKSRDISPKQKNKGLHRVRHDTTTACRQGKVKQVYIKSKCGHSILQSTKLTPTSSDSLTAFLEPNIGPSPNVKKALFFTIS